MVNKIPLFQVCAPFLLLKCIVFLEFLNQITSLCCSQFHFLVQAANYKREK